MMKGEKIYLRKLTVNDLEDLVDMEIRNKELFEQFSVTRRPDFYSIEGQALRLQMQEASWQNDDQYNFGVFLNEGDVLSVRSIWFRWFGGRSKAPLWAIPSTRTITAKGMRQKRCGCWPSTDSANWGCTASKRGLCRITRHRSASWKKPVSIKKASLLKMSRFMASGRTIKFWRSSIQKIKGRGYAGLSNSFDSLFQQW